MKKFMYKKFLFKNVKFLLKHLKSNKKYKINLFIIKYKI